MNVKKEIELYSDEKDIPMLCWLFERYHLESQWSFVACCVHERYGIYSYQSNRVWYPTVEGEILYNHSLNKGAK